jgi:hypothetical protein
MSNQQMKSFVSRNHGRPVVASEPTEEVTRGPELRERTPDLR